MQNKKKQEPDSQVCFFDREAVVTSPLYSLFVHSSEITEDLRSVFIKYKFFH